MQSFLSLILFLLILVATFASNADYINQRGKDVDQKQHRSSEERFSNLNFNAYDGYNAIAEYNLKDNNEKQYNSFWGRLFIDGFPGENGMQYFRGHFGTMPQSLRKVKFVLAQHLDDCSEADDSTILDEDLIDYDTVLVAKRGNCTFGEKAQRAIEAGAGGILFLNNEEGNVHPTAQGKLDLNISTAMISIYNGERLINALKKPMNKVIEGKYVPMMCILDDKDDKNYCDPISSDDKTYVKSFFEKYLHGTITIDDTNFKYEQAQFGTRIEEKDSYHLASPSSHNFSTFCDDSYQGKELAGKAVMVDRGGCHFSKKAENLDLVGAKMMILVNNDEAAFSMGAESDYVASKIKLAAVMVSNETGKDMNKKVERISSEGDNDAKITIHLG